MRQELDSPIGAGEERGHTRNGRDLVGVRLDADARVVLDGEEVVDDLEALAPGREVDAADVDDLLDRKSVV